MSAYAYPAPERSMGFVRAELYRHGELEVITNPLYLLPPDGVAPAEASGVEVREAADADL